MQNKVKDFIVGNFVFQKPISPSNTNRLIEFNNILIPRTFGSLTSLVLPRDWSIEPFVLGSLQLILRGLHRVCSYTCQYGQTFVFCVELISTCSRVS